MTYLTHMEKRLLALRDAKLRRCFFCGEWAYGQEDCTVCAAPADRAALLRETS